MLTDLCKTANEHELPLQLEEGEELDRVNQLGETNLQLNFLGNAIFL